MDRLYNVTEVIPTPGRLCAYSERLSQHQTPWLPGPSYMTCANTSCLIALTSAVSFWVSQGILHYKKEYREIVTCLATEFSGSRLWTKNAEQRKESVTWQTRLTVAVTQHFSVNFDCGTPKSLKQRVCLNLLTVFWFFKYRMFHGSIYQNERNRLWTWVYSHANFMYVFTPGIVY